MKPSCQEEDCKERSTGPWDATIEYGINCDWYKHINASNCRTDCTNATQAHVIHGPNSANIRQSTMTTLWNQRKVSYFQTIEDTEHGERKDDKLPCILSKIEKKLSKIFSNLKSRNFLVQNFCHNSKYLLNGFFKIYYNQV